MLPLLAACITGLVPHLIVASDASVAPTPECDAEDGSLLQSARQYQKRVPLEDSLEELPPVVEGAQGGYWNSLPVPPEAREAETHAPQPHLSGGYDVDPANFRKYRNGGHRRPTDPPAKQEILKLQEFLFGSEPFKRLKALDRELFKRGPWKKLAPAFLEAGIGVLHPATIQGVLDPSVECPRASGSCKRCDGTYEECVNKFGVREASQFMSKCPNLQCKSKDLWQAGEVGVEVPDRQHVLDVEAAIEAGKKKYPMRRILSVRLRGGYHSTTSGKEGDSTKWGSEVFVAVDVADLNDCREVAQDLDVYEVALDYGVKPPAKAPLDSVSSAYLETATSALYLEYETMGTTMGLPANYLPVYNGNMGDFEGVPLSYVMKFAQPFAHKHGRKAYIYGKDAKEWIMSAELANLRSESFPIDGHAISSGTLLGQMPLNFLYAINTTGGRVNPEQTLPGLDGAPVPSAAMTWYGRGLTFNTTGGLNFLAASAAHMGIGVAGTPLAPYEKEKNAAMYAEVAGIVAGAISDAWGNDEAVPGTGFRPGKLVRAKKHGSSVRIPADVVKHSFDVPAFVNHATPEAFRTKGSPFLPPGSTRDARDNAPYMAPPRGEDGEPQYAANGPPPSMANREQAYSIDGYAVTYDVGMKWKMLLSFDRKAGLTFWHVRMRLPPSEESPDGAEYPLLFRANVPNFGTDYATSSLGNPQGFMFLESHATSATAHLKGTSCKGATLPIFKHLGGGGPHLANKYGLKRTSYASLGVPGSVDPVFGLPLEAFPSFDTGMSNDALIEEGVCIEEKAMGVNNWHMYAIQTERCLTIGQTTISDAYNVVVKGEFCNTGHMFFGQDLQGKPAPGKATIDGVGGAYSSRGRGGFASNHIHWGAVALEGHVGGAGENILQVVDSEQDGETDVFGMAFNFITEPVRNTQDKRRLSYSHPLGRSYRIAGVDAKGKEVGGVKVESTCWGSKIRPSPQAKRAGIPPERSYYGNHWWLRDQDVFVLPVNQSQRRRDTMELLSNGRVGQHYDFYRSTASPNRDKDFQGSFAMFSIVKMRHNVQAEELPIQAAFKKHGITVKPHFLEGFNMDILMRYDPEWNRFFQNNFVGTGGDEYADSLPYSSEYSP